MKYANIPHTDLNPSHLCLGTNHFGTIIDQTDAFVDVGGNFKRKMQNGCYVHRKLIEARPWQARQACQQ